MFAILCKIGTGSSSFTGTYHFIGKLLPFLCRHFSNKDLVAVYTLFGICALENEILTIIAPIGFRIIAAKGQLLYILQMCFFRVTQGICFNDTTNCFGASGTGQQYY